VFRHKWNDILNLVFTELMYDKLADWLNNASILCLASIVIPGLLGGKDLDMFEFVVGLSLMISFLWLALRSARLAGREYESSK